MTYYELYEEFCGQPHAGAPNYPVGTLLGAPGNCHIGMALYRASCKACV